MYTREIAVILIVPCLIFAAGLLSDNSEFFRIWPSAEATLPQTQQQQPHPCLQTFALSATQADERFHRGNKFLAAN